MPLTPEERQARMDELKAAREKKYFEAQEAAKEAAKKDLPPLPEADAYVYDYAWRQQVGQPGGKYKLIKSPNPFYDVTTNEIIDPVTGERKKMVLSKYGGTGNNGLPPGYNTNFNTSDYSNAVDAALANRAWLSVNDPMQSLQVLGSIIEKYYPKGSKEYESALLSAAQMGSRSHTDINGKTGTLAEWLKNSISFEQGKKIGINTLAAQIGSDIGGWVNDKGEFISKNDPYMRDRYGNIVYDADGKPTMRPIIDGSQTGSGGSYQNLPYTGYGNSYQNLPYISGPSGSANNPYQPGTEAYKSFEEKKSAWSLLQSEFNRYGLGSLVPSLQSLIQEGVSSSEFALRLRETPQYQQRFAANQQRINKGLRALSEAEYIGLEDQYQNIMRNYGLPQSYYAKGDLGIQPGFEKFIAGDVSASELEDRIQTAQNRIQYANPEVSIALKTFYPDITNGDILGYILDPQTGLANIKRRIQAAEIGGTAVAMGLATNVTDAEYLARYGVTKQQAQQGYQTIGSGLQRGTELSSIYNQSPYTQATAEKEVFGVPGAAEAKKQRQDLAGLERATFSGQTGAGGALARERAGGF